MYRKIVVEDDAFPLSVDEQPNSVVSVGADFCGFEDAFDDKGELADGGNG
jgi:hypothetical protein